MSPPVRRGLPRRTFLGGAAAMIGLPWLPSLLPAARADAAAPVRLVWWNVPNGMNMARWRTEVDGDSYELSPTLSGLADLREHLIVVDGVDLFHGTQSTPAHPTATGGFLTGVTPKPGRVELGISVDQRAAERLGTGTPFPSLQVGVEGPRIESNMDAGFSDAYTRMLSWADPWTPLPPIVDPRVLFDRLFGGLDAAATAEERARRVTRRLSILDAVLDEASSIQHALSAEERQRFDRYLTSVRDLELRIEVQQGLPACAAAQPAEVQLDDVERVTDQLAELMAIALSCGSTRVITFAQGNGGSNMTHGFLGSPEAHHPLSHHEGDPEKLERIAVIDAWRVARFGRFLRRLRDTPEAGGSLLDHCAILYGSELADGNDHEFMDLPLLVAGSAGGAFRTGRRVDAGGRSLVDLHLALLAAADVHLPAWGQGTGPLEALVG